MLHSHKNFWISWWRTIVNGFIHLMKGIVMLITLGWLCPNWDYDYLFYCVKKDLRRKL